MLDLSRTLVGLEGKCNKTPAVAYHAPKWRLKARIKGETIIRLLLQRSFPN